MVAQSLTYIGGLRCELTHDPSKTKLITDAPIDNHGRGESFSPTDLVVSALAGCIVTTMAIAVEPEGVNLHGTTVYAEKHMSADAPRRIAKILIKLDFAKGIPPTYRSRLEHIARTCPVQRSIHPDIVVDLVFNYPD